ncbi:hypothetical protein ES705_20419 [subsurface metagenome]
MVTILLEGTEDTPKVILDPENNIFEISGRSLPEDAVLFYQPVIDWLDELEKNPIDNMNFSFKLEYFNTASSKIILDILIKLQEIYEAGTSITVKWYNLENDEDMEEAGEEYSDLVDVPIEMIKY